MKPALSIHNLSKQYFLGSGQKNSYATLAETISETAARAVSSIVKGRLADSERSVKKAPDSLWALKGVNFDIQPGEIVGIIGRNGAGKSTLLKILSRITEPTSGRIELRGRVGSLLEVGTGFHPELTGRENIFLNGAILGMSRREIAGKLDLIVSFAEMERFIDTPVKRYSSGMYVRLAFAVAAHTDPDILMIDEVLAVGDLAFQRKCMDFAKRLGQSNATVLVVSHNMFAIKALCNRVIYLNDGQVNHDGAVERGIQLYERESRLSVLPWAQKMLGHDPDKCPIRITELKVADHSGRPRNVFEFGERMRLRLSYDAKEPVSTPNFVVSIVRSDNVVCCNYSSSTDGFCIPRAFGKGTIDILTPPIKLIAELYEIHLLVWDGEFHRLHCAQQGTTFHVRHDLFSMHFGVFHESAEWQNDLRDEATADWAVDIETDNQLCPNGGSRM